MINHVDPEIVSGFVKEVEGYLPKLAQSLEEYRNNPERVDSLEEAHRMVHCIRGAGATIGLAALAHIAQYSEDALEQVLSGQLAWNEELASVLEAATSGLAGFLHGIMTGSGAQRSIVTELVAAFRRLRNLPEDGDDAEVERILSTAESTSVSESTNGDEEPDYPDFEKLETPRGESVIQTLDEVAIDDDLWEAFQEEAGEHFKTIAEALATLESHEDKDSLKAIRRSFHQLKGASGVIGMRNTSKVNAAMQKSLDGILEGESKFSKNLLPLYQRSFEIVLEAVGGKGAGAHLADRAKELLTDFESGAAPIQRAEAPAPPVKSAPPEQASVDRVDVGDDLWDAFHQEAEELLHGIGELLRSMENATPQPETIQGLRRSVHTLKGACGIVGMRLTSSVAHRMEDLLDALYEGRQTYSRDLAPLLFATYDLITDAVAHRGIANNQLGKLDQILTGYVDMFGAASETSAQEAAAPAAGKPVELEQTQEVQPAAIESITGHKSTQFVRAPLERVDELVRLVSELVIHRSRFEQYLGAYVHEVSELQLSNERLNRISRKFQSDYEAAALQEANRRGSFVTFGARGFGGSSSDDFDSLEFDRYTEFHLLSRDLAETAGDVTNAGSRLNELISDFDGYLNRLSTLTGDVEDRLMRLRMLPLRSLSPRLHRTVRVTADRRSKLVDLVIEGESVELDKTVLEEMAGPIDHLLRNSVDHGIETTAVRKSKGKAERGTIHLRAYHEGTQVVLQIRDDGQGMDTSRLRAAAVRLGFVSEEDADALADQELYGLIFMPGFSTASEVSEVSGRGVGLDVVKASVSKMKGTLSVNSERGRGTTFIIRLPMTLALTRVVLVKSGVETYAIPLSAISQILRIEPEQLERVGRKPVLRIAGKVVPTMHLAEVVGQQTPPDANLTRLKAVVLNVGEQRLAVMVDQVLEAREVVVKTLGTLLGRVDGVTGATIMGDGSVVLILNPNDMLHQQHTVAPTVRLRAPAPSAKPATESFEVLIVDDSPSVRRVLTNLIRNAGWNPHSAKDGLDALEMIHSGAVRPDVVLLDIEMPRMDGYELTAALRSMPRHRDTPIVMVTSRAGEKHRKRAFELGATDYMIKPYQDEELLGAVRRVVRKGVVRQ